MEYYRIVDSAEPEQIRTMLLERGWSQDRLLSGDFAFLSKDNLKFGITRKTVQDLVSSVGELFAKQLDEMLDNYDICMFFIEGAISFDLSTGYMLGVKGDHNIHAVLDWLHRWQVKGFIMERSPSPEFTVYRLCHLYALWQKPYSFSAKSRRWANEGQLALPSGTRGKSGDNLFQKFDTIQNIANASVQELTAAEGIGQKRAESVYNHFRKSHRRLTVASDEPARIKTIEELFDETL